MNLYLAVTDSDWFRFLRSQPLIDEVNFWQPGGSSSFRRLLPGEPFLFKLHAPENFIVGGGFFAHFSRLPASRAWEAFEEKNGARTFAEMRARIGRYRRAFLDPREDPEIGCVILTQPFFFDEIDWIPIPANFSLNIVQGKTYDALQEPGRSLWMRVQSILRMSQPAELAEVQLPMFGEPVLVRPRLGQGSFRVLITDTYQRRCAVTQERALPVLEAAHIRPVGEGGLHRIDNGLLLRSDLHRLFDRGYVTVTQPDGDVAAAAAGNAAGVPEDAAAAPIHASVAAVHAAGTEDDAAAAEDQSPAAAEHAGGAEDIRRASREMPPGLGKRLRRSQDTLPRAVRSIPGVGATSAGSAGRGAARAAMIPGPAARIPAAAPSSSSSDDECAALSGMISSHRGEAVIMGAAVKKTISLPPELAREAEEIAQAEGKTLSAVVQDALRLARRTRLEQELKELQGYWSRRAKERGILTEDDLAPYLGD